MGIWHYLKSVAWILLAVVLLASPTSTSAQIGPQPNIILIMLDDLGKEGLGTYYRKTYSTPNIDKLAEEGIRFSRFYADPVCVPTRASLMTGLYPPRTGYVSNDKVQLEGDCLNPNIGTFVQDLQNAGYSTAVAGKWHICPFEEIFDHPGQLGFDEWIISPNGRHWGANTWVNGAIAPELETEETYTADEHTNFAIEFIRRNVANPFFLYFPTKLPHRPWSKTPDNLQKKWPDDDPRYFPGMVKYADKMIGRIDQALKAEGIEDETIIIFLTDNGSKARFAGGPGKRNSTEDGINIPLIIKWPGTTRSGATRHNLTDVTDLYPTILKMAGLPAPTNRDGHSLVPALTGNGGATDREWVYAQNGDRFAIRKGNWKLREKMQLFNLLHDPFEENPILPKDDSRTSKKHREELKRILRQEGLGPQ